MKQINVMIISDNKKIHITCRCHPLFNFIVYHKTIVDFQDVLILPYLISHY